jgi:hypothetical protein
MSPLFTAFTFQSIKREPRAGIEPMKTVRRDDQSSGST